MNPQADTLPYCGLPALPTTLWTSWNLDPWLLMAFAAMLGAHAWGRRRAVSQGMSREDGFFYAAWAVALVATVSPLCGLSVALFSARVAQHMLLTLVAAPLFVLSRPSWLVAGAMERGLPASSAGGRLAAVLASGRTAWVAFLAALWFWHAPGSYSLTYTSTAAYWAMHITLFVAAVMLWRALLVRYASAPVQALACGLGTAVQMGLLGALLTFARRPLYAEHWDTTVAWGLSPLDDQQFGGLVMWVPGCTVFLLVAVAAVANWWCDLPHAHRSSVRTTPGIPSRGH